ncbi:MAG: TIGR00341 family protein [Deltaproteobacteria bacterium]|nr:TIGR00341 family protein [Deltaproteobacteria bacterium]
MALRLIEMVLPEDVGNYAHEYLREQRDLPILRFWSQHLASGEVSVSVLLDAEHAEAVLDLLDNNYGSIEGFKAILLPVEASLPRPEPDEEVPAKAEPTGKGSSRRISREELYFDVVDATKLSQVYIAMVLLSAIVASIGVLRDNLAVVIGAMVIAPLLGPSVALSLATTLGDGNLARTALKASAVGIGLTLALSFTVGFFLDVDPTIHEIASRTDVGLSDIALALAAGAAGALAFTSGVPSTLVGVMVAVALLPQLVTCGLLLGSNFLQLAWGTLLLFLTNFIAINLSGVACFLSQGVSPRDWGEADKARKGATKMILLWFTLLFALVAIIVQSQGG